MNSSEILTGQAPAESPPFLRFDGLAHVPLGDGLTLVYRENDSTVTIVGMADVLLPGTVLVLG